MANLLGWLGNAAKRVGNTVNNDVIQPINRDIVQPVNHNVVQPAQNFARPAEQGVIGFGKGVGQIAGIPIEDARIATALATSNQAAAQAAALRNKADLEQLAGFAQFLPRAATQVGLSAYQGLKPGAFNPQAGNLTPSNPVEKILLGNSPVQSFSNVGNQTLKDTGSKAQAVGDVSLQAIMDALALKGGVESVKKAEGVVKPVLSNTLDQRIPLKTNQEGSVRIPFTKGEGDQGVIKLNNPDNAKISGFKINNPDNARIAPPDTGFKINDPNNLLDKPLQINDPNNLLQSPLSGAAQQSALSKLRGKITPIAGDQRGSIQLPGAGKRGLPDSLPNDTPNLNKGAFSKADIANLEKKIAQEQEAHAVGDKPQPGFESMKLGIQKQLNPSLSQKERLKLGNPEQNPLYGKVSIPQASNAGQAHLNANFISGKEQAVGAKALQDLGKLSSKDQELLKSVQTKGTGIASQAENPAAFNKALGSIRQYYDTRHAYDHALGIQTPYRQNYLRDIVDRNKTSDAMPLSGGNKAPGYTQAKTQPGYSNVAEALQRDIKGSSFNHAKLTYTKGLDEAYPGQIQAGKPFTDANTQLQTPFGKELFTNKELAQQINNRAPAIKSDGFLGKYDSANAFIKYAKLSGGAFHAFTEGGNFIGHQITSGKLFTEPGSTGKIFKTLFSDKALRTETKALADKGVLDKAQIGGLTWTPSEIKADVSVTPKGKFAQYTGLKALHDATFQREIPYAKLKSFEQATQGLDPNVPADLAKIRSAAKGVNEAYGGINRAVEGMTPKQAKVASRFLLATDFTEGKIHTITAAISKGGPEGKIARQVVAGKALLFAGMATAGATLGGEYKGKDTKQVAENILGNFVNPTFKAGKSVVSFPATHISEFGKPLTPLFKSPTNKFGGITDYAKNRLAAIPSEVGQLTSNLDYSGNHIYGKETKKAGGAPISPAKTGLNVASGFLPIPAVQGVNTAQGKQGVAAGIANVAGFKVRPDTAATTVPSSTGTPEQKNLAATNEKAALGKNAGNGYSLQKTSDGKYAYTLDGDSTVHTAKSLDDARLAVAKAGFKDATGSYKVVGDNVLRKAPDGTVSVVSKTKFDYQVGTATLTSQKNAGDIKGWLNTANSQLDSIQKQLKDPNIDPLDALTLQNQADTLIADAQKYQSYGGFTKPKAAKSTAGAVASFKTASSVKAPTAPKGITVRAPAQPKVVATRKLAVSKIPTRYKGKSIA